MRLPQVAPGAPDQRSGEMSDQETKKELARAKQDLLEAKAKLKELSTRLTELSDVVEKIDTAQTRLEKIENKLLQEYTKESYFHGLDQD
jgi:predicted transcriptional regulator